jgi:hypothetical protein
MKAIKQIIQRIIGKHKMTNSTQEIEAIDQAEQRPKASSAKLTAEEVKKAIYIDYEGNIKLPPTLLGWYVDGEYKASILEPLFETCENRDVPPDLSSA